MVFKNDELFESSSQTLRSGIDDFLVQSLFSAYAMLHLLNRLEFYILHSEYYEKYLKTMFDMD